TFADDNDTYFMYFFAYPHENGSCPSGDYSEFRIYNTALLQLGQIITYGGILFTISIYGVRSSFGWRLTFFLDDLVILFFGFSPVIPFYIIGQICGRLNNHAFRTQFGYIILAIWIIFSWIILSIIHDFNYRYDISLNKKFYLKFLTAFAHLFCAIAILATNIFGLYYDYFVRLNPMQNEANYIINANALGFFINVAYLLLSIYLTCYVWKHKSNNYEDVHVQIERARYACIKIKSHINFIPFRVFFLTLFLSIIQRVIHDYIMEVDDESHCHRIIDYKENIREAHYLKRKLSLPIRILAFFLFMNFSDGYYTWTNSLVGYVNKKQKYFTSKSRSFKIICRKIKYIEKDQEKPKTLYNKTLSITLNIIDEEEIDLYRKGRIQDNREGKIGYNKWENDWNYWKARLSIKDNQIKLVQQLRLGSKRANDFISINGSVKISIKVSDDDGSDVKIDIKDGDDDITDQDISILIEKDSKLIKIKKAQNNDNINLDGNWKLNFKNGEVYLVNKRVLKCNALNNKGKRAIYLSRVNLNGSLSIKGLSNDSNNERKYKQKDDNYKIIEVDKDINNLKKKLRLDGNTKLKIKDDKIYLEYEVNEEGDSNDLKIEEGNSNDLKIKDKTFEDAMTGHYWYAILKKKENHDKFFLQYEVPSDKDVMQLSVEGNRLINLKYYENNEDNEDTKRSTNNEDNKRSTNNEDNKRSTNIEDIIKLTYDKMVYEEDLTENFKSLTINNECEVRRDKRKDKTIILRFINDTLYRKFKGFFFRRTDEMTISNDYDGTIESRQHSILRRCQHDNYTIEQDDETIIIKIQVYAHSIVKITNENDNEKEKDDNAKELPIVTRLAHGGELKIQINRNDNDQNIGKNGVKIVLSRNINLHNRGLLKIKNGCVTFVEMPENKKFIDLTKHGFLNFVVYHHKKRVEKLRNLKKKLLHK
ncbi:7924_t:CDS:2, partial [Racocetra persica]